MIPSRHSSARRKRWACRCSCSGWHWRCRSLGLRDYTPFPYFGCRVFTDALCALLCWLLGGLVGLGTLICAFCLGPFIQFFNGTVSERVLQYQPGKE